jgi:hypothetical protein
VQQEYPGDPIHHFYSLTTDVESLTLWRRIESLKLYDLSTPTMPSTTAPTPHVAPAAPASIPTKSSTPTKSKINISAYPKLKAKTQWRTFDRQLRLTAASHDTIDILTPIHAMAYFQDKQRFMYNVFTNMIQTTNGNTVIVYVRNPHQWLQRKFILPS